MNARVLISVVTAAALLGCARQIKCTVDEDCDPGERCDLGDTGLCKADTPPVTVSSSSSHAVVSSSSSMGAVSSSRMVVASSSSSALVSSTSVMVVQSSSLPAVSSSSAIVPSSSVESSSVMAVASSSLMAASSSSEAPSSSAMPECTTNADCMTDGKPICGGGTCVGVTSLARGVTLGHMCAVAEDQTVWCWGANDQGQLGVGSTTPMQSHVPRKVAGLSNVASVVVGGNFTCALRTSGTVVCWGSNDQGQLGNRAVPSGRDLQPMTSVQDTAATTLTAIKAISASVDHACAVTTTGALWCWGSNAFQKLGANEPPTAPTASRARAKKVLMVAGTPLTNVQSVALSDRTTCALLGDGSVRCVGSAELTGTGTMDNSAVLAFADTPVTSTEPFTRIDGGDLWTCGITASPDDAGAPITRARCWGAGDVGEFGLGNTFAYAPVDVPGIDAAVSMPGGYRHACVLHDGIVSCAGLNGHGQLGYAGNGSGTMVAVNGLLDVVELVAMWESNCARLADGSVWCWGSNEHGVLGAGLTDFMTAVPNPVQVRF